MAYDSDSGSIFISTYIQNLEEYGVCIINVRQKEFVKFIPFAHRALGITYNPNLKKLYVIGYPTSLGDEWQDNYLYIYKWDSLKRELIFEQKQLLELDETELENLFNIFDICFDNVNNIIYATFSWYDWHLTPITDIVYIYDYNESTDSWEISRKIDTDSEHQPSCYPAYFIDVYNKGDGSTYLFTTSGDRYLKEL